MIITAGLVPVAGAAAIPINPPHLVRIDVHSENELTLVFNHYESVQTNYLYRLYLKAHGGFREIGRVTHMSGGNIEVTITHHPVNANALAEVAIQACESGDDSNCTRSTTYKPVAVTLPTALIAKPTSNTANLSWVYDNSEGGDLEGFELFRRASGGRWTLIGSTGAASRSYTFNDLSADTEYQLGVRAVQKRASPLIHTITQTATVSTLPEPGHISLWDPRRAAIEAGAQIYSVADPERFTGSVVRVSADPDSGFKFSSIRAAIEQAIEGDTILVHDGVYTESLGKIEKRLTIRAANGATPVVLGASEQPKAIGWEPDNNPDLTRLYVGRLMPAPGDNGYEIIAEQLGENSTKEDQDADPAAGHLEQLAYQLSGDKPGDFRYLKQVLSKAEVEADPKNTFYYHRTWQYIYVSSQRFNNATTFWLSRPHNTDQSDSPDNSAFAVRFLSGSEGSSLHGIKFAMFTPFHNDIGGAIEIHGKDSDRLTDRLEDISLSHVTVEASSATGINIQHATGITLEHVTANYNGARGLSANNIKPENNAFGIAIRKSRFDYNNASGFDYRDCAGGVYCVLAGIKITHSTDIELAFNSFMGNKSMGFWCDLECVNSVIVGNHFENNAKHGLYYELSYNATIASNTMVNHTSEDTNGIKVSGSRNVKIFRNSLFNNDSHIAIPHDPRLIIDDVDIKANVFAERAETGTQRILTVVRPDGPTLADRLAAFSFNAYALSTWNRDRFILLDSARYKTPAAFSSNTGGKYAWNATLAPERADPSAVFFDPASFDYQLVDPVLYLANGVAIPANAIGSELIQSQPFVGVGAIYY